MKRCPDNQSSRLVFVARRALPVGLFLALVPLALIGWFHLDSFMDLFVGYFG